MLLLTLFQTASGNWFADVLRHAYDDMLCLKGCGGSDGVFICGGTIRGDSIYGPGMSKTILLKSMSVRLNCDRKRYLGRYP